MESIFQPLCARENKHDIKNAKDILKYDGKTSSLLYIAVVDTILVKIFHNNDNIEEKYTQLRNVS